MNDWWIYLVVGVMAFLLGGGVVMLVNKFLSHHKATQADREAKQLVHDAEVKA